MVLLDKGHIFNQTIYIVSLQLVVVEANRHFNPEWYDRFSRWLEYIENEVVVFS